MNLQEMHRIAILDNGSIEFLRKLKDQNVSYEILLREYDGIIIPGWVWVEVSDSRLRMEFVDDMKNMGLPIYIFNEVDYIQVVEHELILLQMFDMAIRPYAILKSYLRKEIMKGLDYIEVEYLYKEWIDKIYEEWPITGNEIVTSEGIVRRRKKNAGELSIAFLVALLNYSFGNTIEITILSEDADCENCLRKLKEKLKIDRIFDFELRYSFKTSDCIYRELIWQNGILFEKIEKLVDMFRTDKTLIYIKKKFDNTIEICKKKINNENFKIIINDTKYDVIW